MWARTWRRTGCRTGSWRSPSTAPGSARTGSTRAPRSGRPGRRCSARRRCPPSTGQAPGKVSMSGGWTWAIPAKAANPDLAFDFVKTMQTEENAARWDVADAQIAVRKDVAADPAYLNSMPGITFFTGLVQFTHYRPALPGLSAGVDGDRRGDGVGDDRRFGRPRRPRRTTTSEVDRPSDGRVRRDRRRRPGPAGGAECGRCAGCRSRPRPCSCCCSSPGRSATASTSRSPTCS